MSVPAPHFLLYAEASLSAAAQAADFEASYAGRWRFVLRRPGGETSLEAADDEPEAGSERLELLAVVRGLEALESPSRVTLLSGSRHIRRGLESGLSQWRENGWQWERYGRMTPVKNGDLWQRLDRLLQIHAIECRPSRLDTPDDLASPPVRKRAHSQRRSPGGKTVRIDTGHAKSKRRNVSNKSGFRYLNLLLSNLFRISDFVLRALLPPVRSNARKRRFH